MIYQFVKRLLSLAIPLSLSRLLYMLSSFIAVLMLGKLGKLPLAAGVIAISTFSVVLVFTSAIFQSLSILIRKMPKTQQSTAQVMALFQNSIFLALGIALLAACFLWHTDQLLVLTNQDPAIIAVAKSYFRLSALAIIPSLLVSVMNQLTVGIGVARSLLYIELFCFTPRILLYYGFINGYWGLPALGLAGIALTELLVKGFALIILMLRCRLSKLYQPYRQCFTFNLKQFNPTLLRQLLIIGLPIALQSSGEIAAMSVAGYLMGHFGITALAALSVTNQYMIPAMMFAYGLSQALTLLLSEIKDDHLAKTTTTACLQAAFIIMALWTVPFIILFLRYSSDLLDLFVPLTSQDSKLQSLTTSFFIISILFIIVEGIRNIMIGTLWAISNSYKPVVRSLSMIWFVGLPLCYLVAFTFNGGPIGLRLGFLSGLIMSMARLGKSLYPIIFKTKAAYYQKKTLSI